jgi:putative sterol carrier protein
MNTYERMVELIVEISKEDLEYYKGRPSRKKAKKKLTRASKKTQAAKERGEKKKKAEANTQTEEFTKGTLSQRRGK